MLLLHSVWGRKEDTAQQSTDEKQNKKGKQTSQLDSQSAFYSKAKFNCIQMASKLKMHWSP